MALRIVGTPAPRNDAIEKVTGQTRYAADLSMPRMLYARLVRSTHTHARILGIDVAAARAVPGVFAVLTAADLPTGDRRPGFRVDTVLAKDEVVFHGQPVVAIAAE